MTSELREAIRGVRDRFEFADRRVVNTTDRTNVFRQLTGADYISLGALFVGWASALLFVRGEPNWALLAMFGAFCLDKADGWYARRTGTSSPFGRQVDSFIDIFAYLVPAILLYHFVLAPSVFASLIVGFLVLAFGVFGWFDTTATGSATTTVPATTTERPSSTRTSSSSRTTSSRPSSASGTAGWQVC